ncbi:MULTISPECIES: Stk1 family PASTA domain-containing Ser/Thr kinase [unclassified Streptomyces]|uniref:Stk1 family PASTA domain-containing Ser/Thr kinase n=1 Tax=unclassified Streptomyces TaxID=2593676 RepID=UPI0019077B3C|nr:Stk1 family PASTA domain-containing Ser/Thr kinase [Streptomyces sp. HSG2]
MDTTLGDPLVGQVLDGRYRVDARIAVGGMATVYRAVDTRLDRLLALKVMHPALASDAAFVERFIREAKSVARLDHPNVVQVFDQGTAGGYVYLAMEYVSGCTLRDVLRERGALRPRAALDVLESVLAALGAAHLAGFVHRDMKPENVLIGDDGRVKVADFGLVRAVDTVTHTTGSVLGTVSYLAPEQIENGSVDPRVDVYACGVLLYEMLTGARPHPGDSPAQVLYRHLHEEMPSPSAVAPDTAPALDELVAAATARTPVDRPRDAVALLALARETRARLGDGDLDAAPPPRSGEGSAGAEARTTVLPRVPVRPSDHPVAGVGPGQPGGDVQHTRRIETPPSPPTRRGRGRWGPPGTRRGQVAVLVAALVLLVTGTGLWYVVSAQFTQVPPVLAKTEAEARERLAREGLEVGEVAYAPSDTVPRGAVMGTNPAVGDMIRGDRPVSLVVSEGPPTVPLPALAGTEADRARALLRQEGLEPGEVDREFSEDVPQGFVISTDPAAGTEVRTGTTVALTVSKGRAIEVPDVTGEDPAKARAALEEAGLVVETAPDRVESEHAAGRVARQSPAAGNRAGEGDTVTLTLSEGPRMITVPDVVGDDVDEATRRLEAVGFRVEEDRGLFGLFGDTVRGQSVRGGDRAPEGSTITLTIR